MGERFKLLSERCCIAQSGAHEQELCVFEDEERHLPGPSAVFIAKIVELVHADKFDIGIRFPAQGVLCKYFCRAADDRSFAVDHAVACDHADEIFAKEFYEVEELFAHKCFDGSGVVDRFVLCAGEITHAHGDQGFSRTGGCAQDNVLVTCEIEKRFFLVRPERDALALNPAAVAHEGVFGIDGDELVIRREG